MLLKKSNVHTVTSSVRNRHCSLSHVLPLSYAGARPDEDVQDSNGHLCDVHADPGGPLSLRHGLPQQSARRWRGPVHTHPPVNACTGCKSDSGIPTMSVKLDMDAFSIPLLFVVAFPVVHVWLTCKKGQPAPTSQALCCCFNALTGIVVADNGMLQKLHVENDDTRKDRPQTISWSLTFVLPVYWI